jgi:hypothetical protein
MTYCELVSCPGGLDFPILGEEALWLPLLVSGVLTPFRS